MHIPHPSRRGGAYVLVLIVSAIAATIALAGLTMRQAAAERGDTIDDLASARLIAQAGVEAAMQTGDENPGWRAAGGKSRTINYTLGSGKASVTITDPSDNDLTDDDTDPYRFTSTGVVNNSRAVLRVDVAAPPATDYRDRVIAAKPVAFWPLDDPPSFVLSDLTGDLDGGYSSPAVSSRDTGEDGRPAPLFLTTADLGYVPHNDAMRVTQGTFLCSFRCDRGLTGQQVIFSKEEYGPGNEAGGIRAFVELQSGELWLFVRMEDGEYTYREHWVKIIKVGEWYHLAVSFGPDGLNAYVNGERVSWSKQFTVGIEANTSVISIGSWVHTDGIHAPLYGAVRDLVLFDSQLDATTLSGLLTGPESGTHQIDSGSWAWVVD